MDGFFIAETFWLSIAAAIVIALSVAVVGRFGLRRLSARRSAGSSPRNSASARPSPAAPAPRHAESVPRDAGMPATLGRYELVEEIGRGAMGRVFLGRDPKINRVVAIKAVDLANDFDSDEADDAGERFLR